MDDQFGVPFTIWDDVGQGAHWRSRADKTQPFFSVFNLEGHVLESQILPLSPARKGKPLVTNPAAIQVPLGNARTRRPCAKSSRGMQRQHR